MGFNAVGKKLFGIGFALFLGILKQEISHYKEGYF